MNYRELLTIVYNKPANPHNSYPQNHNRTKSLEIVKGEAEARKFIEKVSEYGYEVIRIFNGVGEIVTL